MRLFATAGNDKLISFDKSEYFETDPAIALYEATLGKSLAVFKIRNRNIDDIPGTHNSQWMSI
jgi:hypothetical protein